MANSTGPTARLCHWVCTTQHEDLPAEVRKETVKLLYDQVGSMIAAATLPSCRPVVDLMRKLDSHGECSIVGHPVRTSVTNAALANGSIGHGDEVDATGQHGTGHFPATTVPTVLTVGQYTGASGRELCRALALGSEVASRITSVMGRYYTRAQFYTGLGGAMGAAVSAGLLLGLDAEKMENALALTASGIGGLISFHLDALHQIKSLNHGRYAQAAVLSALLARDDFHGPKEILTIENGFFDAFLGLPMAGNEVVEGLGETYLMHQIAYKRHPVGGPDQAPLYAFLQLMATHKLIADDIDYIEVIISREAFYTVKTNQYPSVHMETILALAAVYGELSFPHLHDPRYLTDARVKAFRERARIFIIPRPEAPTKGQRMEARITVRTCKGKTLSQELRYPLMSEAEIQHKFRTLSGLRLDSGRVADLEKKLMAIETVANVAPLIRELELPY